MIEDLKPLLGKLAIFAKDRLDFKYPPRLFLKQDKENGGCALGKTAHYDPFEKAITIFVSNRHPKDILRSFAHELVHHCQNLRGDLTPEKMKTMSKNYAQENDHMRKMEKEAYLEGNMCFRDWEDSLEDKLQYKITIAIAEQKFLKENKQMTVKINKQFLKGLITKLLEEKESEEIISEESACSEGCDCDECLAKAELKEDQDTSEEDQDTSEEDQEPKDTSEVPRETKSEKVGDLPDTSEEPKETTSKTIQESKIQTPEQENTLYEQRFTPKNTRLYEKLLKEWTK